MKKSTSKDGKIKPIKKSNTRISRPSRAAEKSDISEMRKEEKVVKNEIKKDKIVLWGLLIAILVLGGIYAYRTFMPEETAKTNLTTGENSITFNGFPFEKRDDGFWYTDITVDYFTQKLRYEVPFYYNPSEVQDIPFRRGLEYIFMDAPNIYITVNPEHNTTAVLAGTEISKILGKVWFKNVKAGLIKTTGDTPYPIITCKNISKDVRVIELRIGNETKIYQENGCIIVQGTDENELVRASDRLSFRMLKIMTN